MTNSPVTPIIVPRLPSDLTVVLVKWHVEAGDRIDAGTAIATVEASKSTCDIYAPVEGFIQFGKVAVGEEVEVGTLLAFVTARPDTALPDVIDVSGIANFPMRKEENRVPLTSSRRRLSTALSVHNRRAIPSRVVVRAALEPVETAIKRLQASVGMITTAELIAWTTARVLCHFPELNATFVDDAVLYHQKVNIGFVVDVDDRLFVPVVRNASELTLKEFSIALKELVLQTARHELSESDCKDGTFTVSSLFTGGVADFDPILNVDQSAILGIASPDGDSFPLILIFDHRFVTGRRAAEFLHKVCDQLASSNEIA